MSTSFASLQGLYVHVPFCAQVCKYCDFAVIQKGKRLQDEWLRLVEREITAIADESCDTLYIGGGTPSELRPEIWQRLLEVCRTKLRKNYSEFAVEANPDSLSESFLVLADEAGVRRISVGVQSFNDELLRKIGRSHSALTARKSLQKLRESYPQWSLNADLMFCLPGQKVNDFCDDIHSLAELGVDHISFYGLTLESPSHMEQEIRKGMYQQPENYDEFYEKGVEVAQSLGYERYEVSNFARPGHASIHNQIYWYSGSWHGAGPGAHAFNSKLNQRLAHSKRYTEWKKVVLGGSKRTEEVLNASERLQEELWLGLRTAQGIDEKGILGRYGETAINQKQVQKYVKENMLHFREGKLALQNKGWLFLDQIAIDLCGKSKIEQIKLV
jgi:oxygen-independent coproporphyrinogen-3 oxidase